MCKEEKHRKTGKAMRKRKDPKVIVYQTILIFKDMARFEMEAPFDEYRGKICKHARIIHKKVYDTLYTSQICNPYKGEPSPAQKAQREKFKQARANALALSEAENTAYRTAFKKQREYHSFLGYKIAQELKKLSIVIVLFYFLIF